MSGFKVAVGLGFFVVLSFWVGRRSALPDEVPRVDPGRLAASWDGGALLQSEVEAHLALLGPSGASAHGDTAARTEIVSTLAHQALLASVARARGIDRNPAVRARCDEALVDALRDNQLKAEVQVTESALLAEYERERERYSQAAGIKVAHILLKDDAEGQKKAPTLLRELTEKTKKDFYAFSDAAQVQSIDGASKLAGGELPLMTEMQLKESFGADFPARLESLEPGALLPQVISTSRGLHIVRLLERVDATTVPFERVRESIATRMQAERSKSEWSGFVKRLELDTGFVIAP